MIYVTVGTHEQNFDRLLIKIDELIHLGIMNGDVFAQIGYSDYLPKNFNYTKFLTYDESIQYLTSSELVISHGGPSTFMVPLMNNIPTIVVPRLKEFGEHVNNHQLDFCVKMNQNGFDIKYIVDIDQLNELVSSIEIKNKNDKIHATKDLFINAFIEVVNDL